MDLVSPFKLNRINYIDIILSYTTKSNLLATLKYQNKLDSGTSIHENTENTGIYC